MGCLLTCDLGVRAVVEHVGQRYGQTGSVGKQKGIKKQSAVVGSLYAALWRLSTTRSERLRPPQMPSSLLSCSRDHAKHSSTTRHLPHTFFAGPDGWPRSGNHVMSSGASLQAASACHDGREDSSSEAMSSSSDHEPDLGSSISGMSTISDLPT